MRTPAGTLVLVLVQALAACNSHSSMPPTAPTSTPSQPAPPVPATVAGERWNLTSTYTGHTGPEACIPRFDGKVRQPFTSVVLIQRAGESIHVMTEHDHYVGTVVAEVFSASDRDDVGGTWQCGNARVHYRVEGNVSGRFAEDGRALTGEEVALFRLESGETITRHWAWSATRQ